MALLLSLETSTHSFSCALHEDGKMIESKESVAEQSTASQIAVAIDNLFKNSGRKTNELDAVVVASGPGSYTGLRIGVATAKGICFALTIPLISVNTLWLMAWQFIYQGSGQWDLEEALVCPMLDARRMEVYCLIVDKVARVIEPVQAKVIDEQSFSDRLKRGKIYFFGDGSDKCRNSIHHANAKFISGIRPNASGLGVVGFEKFAKNEFENAADFEPLYLKDFVIKKPNLVR